MNTIQDLNTWGQTQVDYVDDRLAKVVFDRLVPTNRTTSATYGGSHVVPIGINIIELVKADTLDIRLEVDVSSVAGATVTWATPPEGITITNPIVGIYRASGITTLDQWSSVRTPNVNLPSGYDEDFSYFVTLRYNPSQIKQYIVDVEISAIANVSAIFNSVANVGVRKQFASNMTAFNSQMFTGVRIKNSAVNPIASVASITTNNRRVRFVSSALTSSATASGTLVGLRDYNSAMSSAFTQPNTFIAGRAYTISSVNYSSDTTAQLRAWDYGPFTIVSALDTYKVSNYYAQGNFTENKVDIYTNTGTWGLQQSISGPSNFGMQVALNSAANKLVATSNNTIYVYTRSGSTWSLAQTISYGGTISPSDQSAIEFSADGNYFAIAGIASGDDLKIYKFDGSNYQLDSTVSVDIARSVRFSDSAEYMTTVGGTNQGTFQIWSRSGSTWSEQYLDFYSSENINTYASISATGAYAAVITNGRLLAFDRSGSSWSKVADIRTPEGLPVGTGFGPDISLASSGNIQVRSGAFTYNYNRIT
jgi:hypothetical protein